MAKKCAKASKPKKPKLYTEDYLYAVKLKNDDTIYFKKIEDLLDQNKNLKSGHYPVTEFPTTKKEMLAYISVLLNESSFIEYWYDDFDCIRVINKVPIKNQKVLLDKYNSDLKIYLEQQKKEIDNQLKSL